MSGEDSFSCFTYLADFLVNIWFADLLEISFENVPPILHLCQGLFFTLMIFLGKEGIVTVISGLTKDD
jgi:hypothetical protein